MKRYFPTLYILLQHIVVIPCGIVLPRILPPVFATELIGAIRLRLAVSNNTVIVCSPSAIQSS